MTVWTVYLEVDADGRCIGHVAELPGCFAHAERRDDVEQQLPDAIRRFLAWLAARGEPAPQWRDGDEIRVASVNEGFGPFDPGDAAMLLPDEREPLTEDDLERAIRLAGYSRAELLAMVADLDDTLLDWKPPAATMSVREILRHIGNVEEWYLSRLVRPEDLPPEWEHDDQLPIFAFLEMERRTVIAGFRTLPQEARGQMFYPTHWSRHPSEPWTARKALRRLLEHEREHLMQIREMLAQQR
jgi:predicted RNase H-like HicB family nuclease/uncharacterized damage-inducible protein DinB